MCVVRVQMCSVCVMCVLCVVCVCVVGQILAITFSWCPMVTGVNFHLAK